MHALQSRLVSVIAFITTTSFAGEATALAEATRRLEAARSTLAVAVKRIEVDAPSTEDLEAARVAVDGLSAVLAAGAELETTDLDYAKAVLTARRELRGHREYVEQRRANIAIFELRRKIDGALKTMGSRVPAVLAVDQLESAREEITEVRVLVAQGRPLVRQDPKLGTYLDSVDASATKQEKAVGDRWLQLSADKQRELLAEASQGLSAALTELATGFTDERFAAADKAIAVLSRRLAEGKPLEEKERAYRAEADKARAALLQARTKTEDSVANAGVSRVKAEVDAPFSELMTSVKTLRSGKPSPEQLSEAKTATFVVRKLVEKYDPQSARSPPIAQYLSKVRDVLNEAEVVLQLKALQVARADVNGALRALAKRLPSEDEFAEAKASVVVLEKSLETTTGRDDKLAASVADARQAVKDSRAEIEKRRYQVDLTLQRVKADDLRKAAAALVAQLAKEKATDAQMADAEKAVRDASAALQAGSSFIKKDSDYAIFDQETKAKLAELNERISRRKIVLSAMDAKAQMIELIAISRGSIEAAKAVAATDAELDAAIKSVEQVGKMLDERGPLERQDYAYGVYAERARNDLMRLMEGLDQASRLRTTRRTTGDALSAANRELSEAGAIDDARKKKGLYESASLKLKSCKEEGAKLLEDDSKLANIDVLVGGQASKPGEVIAACGKSLAEIPEQLKQTVAQIRYEDGPKRAFEAGTALLNKGKREEARIQFDDCIATAAIEGHRYPELKERPRAAGGLSLTLVELSQKCDAQRRALKASK